MHTEILIVGSGFAGRAVASKLNPDRFLIVERGEYRSHSEMARRYAQNLNPRLPPWENARAAYRSDLPWNQTYKLAARAFSQFEFIGGGSSNRWTGVAVRLSNDTFQYQDGILRWPFPVDTMQRYYAQAEKALNVGVDPVARGIEETQGNIENTKYWHDLLQPRFGAIEVRAQAKNLNPFPIANQNPCCGAANCEMCPVDSKARPETVFNAMPIKYGTFVREIMFEGGKAVAAKCQTADAEETITFDKIVIGAHGVESPALLARSMIPEKQIAQKLGSYFQDHAVAELYVKLDQPIDYFALNTNAAIDLKDISGRYGGIEVQANFRVGAPPSNIFQYAMDLNVLRTRREDAFLRDLAGVAGLYLLLEIPPEFNLSLIFNQNGDPPQLNDSGYWENIGVYHETVNSVVRRLESLGLPVIASNAVYTGSYGTHHLMGTLNMSNTEEGIVDEEFRLKGTNNVYIAGSSLFPRSGANNPTLTIVALALMLGEQLSKHDRP